MNLGSEKILNLVLMAGSLTLPVQCEGGFKADEVITKEQGANVRIVNFHRESFTDSGKKEWNLNAEEAYVFKQNDEESRIIVYQFATEDFNATGKSNGRTTGERAEVNYLENRMYLSGHVEADTTDGKHLKGEKMEYDMKEKILRSDSPVNVVENKNTTVCQAGVVYYKEQKKLLCRAPAGMHAGIKGQSETPSKSKEPDLFH